MKIFTRGTNIQAETDSCVRLKYSHHEKVVVVDDEVAFVGGIDLTLDGGDPFDTPKHPSRGQIGWHDAAVRIEGPAVADVANHFRLRWRGPGEERLPEPTPPAPNGDVELQVVRTLPEDVFVTMPEGEFSVFESYTRALRARSASSTSRTSSSGRPRSSRSSSTSSAIRPPTTSAWSRSRAPERRGGRLAGAISALIHADDEASGSSPARSMREPGRSATSSTCTRRSGSSTTAG